MRGRRLLCDRGANSLELFQVQQVMRRIEAAEMFQALFSALGMHADAPEIVGAEPLPETQVGLAQRKELRLRGVEGHVAIPEAVGPQILVVPNQRDRKSVV